MNKTLKSSLKVFRFLGCEIFVLKTRCNRTDLLLQNNPGYIADTSSQDPGKLMSNSANIQVLGWLTVPFYLLHQTEEHAYDLRGWRYAFVPGFNHGASGQRFGWGQ